MIEITEEGKERLVKTFNEWMRRYTEHPEQFQREFQTVGDFLTEQAHGKTPSYGKKCVAYLCQLFTEMQEDE